ALRGKGRRDEHRGGGAAGRRAGLEAGERAVELRRGHHFLEADRIAEDGERIVRRVAARLDRDFRESLVLRAIAFLIVAAAAAEKLRRPRCLLVLALDRMGNVGEPFHWRLAVVEDVAERAGEHLLEADGEHAVGAAERDELARKIE